MHSVCERLTHVRVRGHLTWTPLRDPPQGGSPWERADLGNHQVVPASKPRESRSRPPSPPVAGAVVDASKGSAGVSVTLTPSSSKKRLRRVDKSDSQLGHPPGGARCRRAGPGRGEDGRRRARPVEGAPPGPVVRPRPRRRPPGGAPQASRPPSAMARAGLRGGRGLEELQRLAGLPACPPPPSPPTPPSPSIPVTAVPSHARQALKLPGGRRSEGGGRAPSGTSPPGSSPPGSSCSSALS